ncbi:MAG: hypothetical protein MUD01_09990 [Chloroflexaceae bacterium]|jgi:hypothetical protein|nr:hypothetical protein [Chloroflexaceae bacterium]
MALLYLAIAWYATGGLLISDYERRGKRTIDLPVPVKYLAWPVSLCIIAFTWN